MKIKQVGTDFNRYFPAVTGLVNDFEYTVLVGKNGLYPMAHVCLFLGRGEVCGRHGQQRFSGVAVHPAGNVIDFYEGSGFPFPGRLIHEYRIIGTVEQQVVALITLTQFFLDLLALRRVKAG